MNKEELKEWLESHQQLKIEAKNTYRIWKKLERDKLSFSVTTDDMPKTSNPRTLEDVIAESDMLSHKYYNLHLEALKRAGDIEQFITKIDDVLTRNVLRLKYIEGYQWWKVAKELNGTESNFRAIRDKILIQAQIGA